jgi:hypothetical protein
VKALHDETLAGTGSTVKDGGGESSAREVAEDLARGDVLGSEVWENDERWEMGRTGRTRRDRPKVHESIPRPNMAVSAAATLTRMD